MDGPTAFHDAFQDGIWTKYEHNPVMVRSQPWSESLGISEPNLFYKDGTFRVFFSQSWHKGKHTAMGSATSTDGFTWIKHPGNPVLIMADDDVGRPAVTEHDGRYYAFAVQHEDDAGKATMRRWSSPDGIRWGDERVVMRCDHPWEGGLSNSATVVDHDGTWHMLYTGGHDCDDGLPEFGYARSADGVNWDKYEGNPVLSGFYGGDPCLVKIGDEYFTWHSRLCHDSLRICCHRSTDMIHWDPIDGRPQINYTQPWEHGLPPEQGGTTDSWYGQLADATVCEAPGRVFMLYGGAQCPLGVATFDGTLERLAERLNDPPLSAWKASSFGMVEGGALKIADNGSDQRPLVAEVRGVHDRYAVEARIRCYDGATHRISVVMRYAESAALGAPGPSFARFWLHDPEHTFYQERHIGLMGPPCQMGANDACDNKWHDWRIEVDGDRNRLFIDRKRVGEYRSSAALLRVLAGEPVHVGFGVLDTYAAVDYVRVLTD